MNYIRLDCYLRITFLCQSGPKHRYKIANTAFSENYNYITMGELRSLFYSLKSQ